MLRNIVVAGCIVSCEDDAAQVSDSSDDSNSDFSEDSDAEKAVALSALAMVMQAPEETGMDRSKRVWDLDRLDALGGDEDLVENFRFEQEYLVVLLNGLRIPNRMVINGSVYYKLEVITATLWRGATAAQGNKAEPQFGLDRRRLSEMKCWMSQAMEGDHCRTLHTLQPWFDQLEYMVDCVAAIAGTPAKVLGIFCSGDGHFHEVCRPYEGGARAEGGTPVPYGPVQQSIFSGHTRGHGFTWDTLQLANGITGLAECGSSRHGSYSFHDEYIPLNPMLWQVMVSYLSIQVWTLR